MNICGYHLRCLNHGNSCLECRYQCNDKNKDYLHDVLNVWPKGKEAGKEKELQIKDEGKLCWKH
ncbi:MAG: hypothetical protein HQL12_06695 [Candidatus Omnitrophica bacterium]|nr:hypothetical protein [Candidatus Omnitrophota bacterium]